MTEKLEQELGPDTADLGLRVGLHSGQVVAGVLRGEKSRFQLFGDTVNTASRMESTGIANQIQISQETAKHLVDAGKSHWFIQREDSIQAKGKGVLQTYWLAIKTTNGNGTVASGFGIDDLDISKEKQEKQNSRIARWTVQVLSTLLKEIISSRKSRGVPCDPLVKMMHFEENYQDAHQPLEEVEEIIMLPEYNAKKYHSKDASEINLDSLIVTELQDYVQMISRLYNNNAFHNFQHAVGNFLLLYGLTRFLNPFSNLCHQIVYRTT